MHEVCKRIEAFITQHRLIFCLSFEFRRTHTSASHSSHMNKLCSCYFLEATMKTECVTCVTRLNTQGHHANIRSTRTAGLRVNDYALFHWIHIDKWVKMVSSFSFLLRILAFGIIYDFITSKKIIFQFFKFLHFRNWFSKKKKTEKIRPPCFRKSHQLKPIWKSYLVLRLDCMHRAFAFGQHKCLDCLNH